VGLAVVAACSGADDGRVWTGSTLDSAGVTIVVNPEEGVWTAAGTWVLEEDLRIGSADGGPEYQFGQIGSIALTSRGDVVVVDRQARQVRVYSRTGTFLRSMGRPGSGPGEFSRSVADALVAPGDTILVPDVQNRRIHRFGPDGTLLADVPLDVSRYRPLRFDVNPSSHGMTAQLRPVGTTPGPDAPSMDELRVIEPSGRFGDTLLQVPSGGLFGPNIVRYFTPEPMWDVTDSSTVLYAVNSTYRIRSYDRDGVLRRIISKPSEPRPITDRDIRAFFSYLDRAWLAAGVPPSRLAVNHRRVSFAEMFPAFAVFHVGPQGTIWVQRVQAPGDLSDEAIEQYNFIEDFGAAEWDVFDRNGRFLGVVTMPGRFQPRLFTEEAVYGVARDELDVQYLTRLQVKHGIQ
jgi:hypothetical protein